ncbi:MAG: L-histidine N(alpha)-methyltransferase [Acidimicrobiales bacterium]
MSTQTRTVNDVVERLRATRRLTEGLAAPLAPEDQVVQSMPDVSPTKWHRAHTTWFFETFVLGPHLAGYQPVHAAYDYLFNSYYEAVGPRHPRAERGLISRPTAEEVGEYRAAVDRALDELVASLDHDALAEVAPLLELGGTTSSTRSCCSWTSSTCSRATRCAPPTASAPRRCRARPPRPSVGWTWPTSASSGWAPTTTGCAFDNERPAHDLLLRPFRLADRLATEGEWLAFMADGGYERPELWLSGGLGHGVGPGLASAALLGSRWRRLERVHAGRHPSGARCHAGGPHQLLRGRRLRPLVGRPPRHRGGVGGRVQPGWVPARPERPRRRRPAPPTGGPRRDRRRSTAPGRWLGVDRQRLRPLSGLPARGRGDRRVQRQVHVQPAHAARRRARDALGPHPAHLPQLLPASARWAFSTVRLADDLEPPRPSRSAGPDRCVHHHRPDRLAAPPVVEPRVDVHLHPADLERALRSDVATGLGATPATLPPKWFYDDRGSELFDQITRLDEYYPTRREREILEREAATIAEASGADTLVELGSGTSDKTRLLLDAFEATGQLERFVPFDVSEGILRWAAHTIAERHPGLAVHGVVGDFDHHLDALPAGGRRTVAFLGGTIGNFEPAHRARFLADLAASLRPGDSLLLGTDLVKDPERLVAAYDDAAGVTAEFNRNVLAVLAHRLDAELDPDGWAHEARWNDVDEWIEMHLVARGSQQVSVPSLGVSRSFAPGESIRTEISAKFRRERGGRAGRRRVHHHALVDRRPGRLRAQPVEPGLTGPGPVRSR